MRRQSHAHFDTKVPLLMGCVLFMEWFDATAVIAALVQIAADFDEPSVRMNSVVSLYLLAVAIFLPISTWLAERFGPRRILLIAIGLFFIGALACALSRSLAQLCAARFCQGIAGAMMMPVGQMILVRWAGKKYLLQAMTFLTMPALLGPAIGPLVGGAMVTLLSWQWIFLINLPIGLLGMMFIVRWVPNEQGTAKLPLDWRGFALSASALSCLMAAFETLAQGVISVYGCAILLLLGLVCAGLYWQHAKRTAEPIIDLSLLRIPTFSVVFWGGFLFRLGSTSAPFLLMLLFQVVFGLSALEAGLITFASGLGAFAIKFLSMPLVKHFGFRQLLLLSTLLAAVFSALCSLLTIDTPYVITLALLFMGGVSRSLNMSSLASLGYADVPAHRVAKASTLTAISMQLSVSLAVGIAALCINMSLLMRAAQQPNQQDVTIALLCGSLLCLSACFIFRSLHRHSGRAISEPTH